MFEINDNVRATHKEQEEKEGPIVLRHHIKKERVKFIVGMGGITLHTDNSKMLRLGNRPDTGPTLTNKHTFSAPVRHGA